MTWIQLHVSVTGVDAERLGDWLEGQGAVAVTLAADSERQVPPLFGEPDSPSEVLWTAVRLTALFGPHTNLGPVLDELRRAVGVSGAVLEPLSEQDWSRTWMDRYRPLQFGDRLWVVPGWLQPPDPSAVNVLLDPGMAFGTGTHPTTALCLEWLARRSTIAGTRLIDYGCGSGILAIAAAKLGAANVTAVDIDPQALRVAAENAAKNQVAGAIVLTHPDGVQGEHADVLVANILLGPLQGLAARLASLVRPSGELALSGLLTEQLDACVDAYAPWFDFVERSESDGWGLIAGVRR